MRKRNIDSDQLNWCSLSLAALSSIFRIQPKKRMKKKRLFFACLGLDYAHIEKLL